jgi:transposase
MSSTACDGSSAPARRGATCPRTFPPWEVVYQQSRRWLAAGCFEVMVHDLRAVLRFAVGRNPEPSAALFDGRTSQSTPESGPRAGYDGSKRRKGSKVHLAVDTLGHLLALHVTPAHEQERDHVAVLSLAVQEVTGESVQLAFVDQGYTGDEAEADAGSYGIHLQVVSLPEAKCGFVLLLRRWVVERSNAWMARFRPLARDYERPSSIGCRSIGSRETAGRSAVSSAGSPPTRWQVVARAVLTQEFVLSTYAHMKIPWFDQRPLDVSHRGQLFFSHWTSILSRPICS